MPRTAPSARQNRTTPVWRLANWPQVASTGPPSPIQVPVAPKPIQLQVYWRPFSLVVPRPSPKSRVLLDPSGMVARETVVRLSRTPAYFDQRGSVLGCPDRTP